MKRESGENPEQARCCKFRTVCIESPTTGECREGDANEISQKTCQ